MISTTAVTLTDFKQFVPDPTIRVDPPPDNPLVAASSVSFTRSGDSFSVKLAEDYPQETSSSSVERILEGIVSRARRDVDRYPESARTHLNYGLALLNCHQLQTAAIEFERALEAEPTNYLAGMNLARIKVLQQRFEEAEELYTRLHKSYPTDPGPAMNLAYLSLRRLDLRAAEELLKKVVSLDDRAVLPRYHLAVVLLHLGKSREAISHLKVAARNEVRAPTVHHALGVAYAMEGDLRRAAHSFRGALTLAPGMREATHALSHVFLRQGEHEKATQLLSDYLARVAPNDREAREILAQAYKELGRYRDARLEWLQAFEAIRDRGEDELALRERSRVMNNIGACFALERQYGPATDWLNRAIKLCPDRDPIQYNNLARVYLKVGEAEVARALLVDCRTRFPANSETRLLLAIGLENLRRYNEAISELERLIETGNADPEAYADLGWIVADAKRDIDSALAVLKEGYQRFPAHVGIVNNLAYVHLLRGEPAPARKLLESAPEGDLKSRVVLTATWGLLRLWEGDIEEGADHYRRAEQMASHAGEKELARIVRQKMHLEIARAYDRSRDIIVAINEIDKGLKVKGGRELYREDLESLKRSIQARSRNELLN